MKQIEDSRLRLMVFKSALELGKKVDEHLLEMYGLDKDEAFRLYDTFGFPIELTEECAEESEDEIYEIIE